MNLDRRSFAKSFTGVIGSLVAGQKVVTASTETHGGFPGRGKAREHIERYVTSGLPQGPVMPAGAALA